jgi:hypothetical protein
VSGLDWDLRATGPNQLKHLPAEFRRVRWVLLAARPADDIEIDPLQGRAQLRPIEVAVIVDLPLWTPKTQTVGCPRKRGNFTVSSQQTRKR